jgi:transcriptional regulator with XRE-family HTH domain
MKAKTLRFNGKALRDLRDKKKLTALVLSDDLGISRTTITMWEADASQPSADMLYEIADYFGVDTKELMK